MRVVAIVQARMGSTRLPGKVMRDIAGKPMIEHVLRRAAAIRGIDEVVVATTESPLDDPLSDYVASSGFSLFRGSEDDVLARYAAAAAVARADAIVRVTADCPLLCPSVSSRVVEAFTANATNLDYVSNTLDRTFPRGLDTEVFTRASLETANREAVTPAEREHVTPFVWRRPERFPLAQVRDEVDRSYHRWTVDTSEDLELVRRVFDELYDVSTPVFDYAAILGCLDRHQDWLAINENVQQKQLSG